MIILEREEVMKVRVLEDKCIGCGSCVSLTDEKIFDFDEETGKAKSLVEEVNQEDEELAKQAMEYCPTDAITEDK